MVGVFSGERKALAPRRVRRLELRRTAPDIFESSESLEGVKGVRRGKVVSEMVVSSVMTRRPPVLEVRIASRPRRRGVPWESARRVWYSGSVGRENIAGLDGVDETVGGSMVLMG